MSYRGHVLVVINLILSVLWHRLACIDPPASLLSDIPRIFSATNTKHWISQSVLFFPKEEGRQGLVHLASRGAAFRLQFIQRLITGRTDLVWRPLSCCILQQFGGLELGLSLFLMDFKTVNFSSLPAVYRSMFIFWFLLKKEIRGYIVSLYWLFQEPMISEGRLGTLTWAGPSLSELFHIARIYTLGQVIDLAGPWLDNRVHLVAHLRVRSTRFTCQLLKQWKHELTEHECNVLTDYCGGSLRGGLIWGSVLILDQLEGRCTNPL